ncbi:MAG: RsmB/NOP family class I SAM-dependent RNA methyltransferase [Alphaproteobacteria bacterium]|nr:RsmB/NOP family class I SAM-dependent RNA methyltransferase [Alphaproteobacteria bacterium]
MTPGARLAAACELFDLARRAGAADREIQAYFRARRYAGAKDRAWISDAVFLAERREAELRFLLGGDASARLGLFAALLIEGRSTLEDLARLCDGAGHAPLPLLEAERARLAGALARMQDAWPDWVRGGYPPWLEPELRRRFGDGIVPEMAALKARAPLDLRVNTLKATRPDILARLRDAGFDAAPTPYSPVGIRLAGHPRIDRLDLAREGLVETQDEGSQLAALMVGARPNMCVVDLCAGAGGKTLALAAEMGGQGELVASDADPARLRRLEPRLARAGAYCVSILDPATLFHGRLGRADRVLLDVPCSGTGTWRRQPWARWRFGPEDLARDRRLQAGLLSEGARLVRPGGRLVYVTCSLLPCENEDQVHSFLAAHPEFEPVPAAEVWRARLDGAAPGTDPWLRLSPREHGTDGFFVAVLRRKDRGAGDV